MRIELQLKLSTKKYSWLCFKHAIEESLKGAYVEKEIDDFNSEYYTGVTVCERCE
jgi:hypothetical protein